MNDDRDGDLDAFLDASRVVAVAGTPAVTETADTAVAS